MIGRKNINNITYYSMSGCVKEFIGGSNRHTIKNFIDFLVDSEIIEKEEIQYRFRKQYVYKLSEKFKNHIIDHYYTEPKKIKGEIKNSTIYFDVFMSKVLVRAYLDYEQKQEENNFEDKKEEVIFTETDLKDYMLEIALKYYVPNNNDIK